MNNKKLKSLILGSSPSLVLSTALSASCFKNSYNISDADIKIRLLNNNINAENIKIDDIVFEYDKSKYIIKEPKLVVIENDAVISFNIAFKNNNHPPIAKAFKISLPKPSNSKDTEKIIISPGNDNKPNENSQNNSGHNERNNNNKPNESVNPKTPINKPENANNNASMHSYSSNYLLSKSSYDIATENAEYKYAVNNINKFLNTANSGNPVNFRYGGVNSNKELLDKYWEYTKEIGIYGNYGTSPEQKVDFYNNTLSANGMYIQKFLPNFNETAKNSAIKHTVDLDDIIAKNPFGFLPSNLSQLFYYMDYKSASKVLGIKDKIVNIKANFDDKKGSIELLIFTDKNKYIVNIDKSNSRSLRNDLDFYQYIYDHSFSIRIGTVEFRRDDFRLKPDHLTTSQTIGTVWVMDRIISPEAEKDNSYELLLATNMHVFNLRKTFDKSLYFDNESSINANRWYGGFWDIENFYDSVTNIYSKRQNIYFMGSRGKDDRLSSNISEIAGDQFKDAKLFFKAYEQYLTAPYYTPRYYTNGIMGNDISIAPQYFDKYDESSRIGESKNAGADFVLLRLRIKKANLAQILPELAKVVGTDKEKDWHIGVGKSGKHHPIKTTFYGGYPSVNQSDYGDKNDVHFKSAKSQGGLVNVQNRVIADPNINSLWVKYNEEQNKDWNSINNNWKKYTKSFINKPNTRFDNEHGMPLTTINQHSNMYTLALDNNKDNLLGEGSSGSLAVDSSFNLVGINYLYTYDKLYNTYSNAISLMEGHSTYSNNFDGNLRNDIKNKLIKDNVYSIKINPK
ncbi:hypothetical protein FCL65_00540 [Mycoplasma bovis]|nr:hypothetical protein [Mycoplasmopsis bovis]